MLDHRESIDPHVRRQLTTLRVIHIALITGVVLFALVVLLAIRPPTGAPGSPGGTGGTGGGAGGGAMDLNILRFIVGGLLVASVLAAMFTRKLAVRQFAALPEQPAEAPMMNTYFVLWMFGVFLAEGAAMLACVIMLMSGNQADLALVAAPLVLMLLYAPTRGKWENFRQRVMNERTLANR